MANLKSIKRALLCSVLALVLCFTMLLGTTFAWFTDSVTSANNKIIAGDLDVELRLWNGTGDTDYVEITNESKPIFGGVDSLTQDTVWEPGKTEVVYLSLKNAGSLDLKYKVAIEVRNPVDGKNLYEVMEYAIVNDARYGSVTAWGNGIDVTLGTNSTQANNVPLTSEQEHFFALAVHMDEEANNDYMNGSVEFDIKVFAAQLVSEEDSFGNTYDQLATYDDKVFVINDTTVTATATTAGESVTLANADNTFKATAKAATAGGEVKAVISNINSTDSVFNAVAADGKSLLSYDIKVTGQEAGSDVTVELFIGTNLMGVEIYHKGVAMLTEEYSYNATTGIVTITTDDFSPFEIALRPAGDIPVAKVVTLADYPEDLDVAYMFSTTEELPEPEGENGEYTDEQVEAFLEKIAPYTFWHADFVVSLDKDIEANEIVLGGQYDAWSENWVNIQNPEAIKAGDELRLLWYASQLMNKQDVLDYIYINYAELCAYVQNFKCGVGSLNPELAGSTITVELRLYETYSEEEALELFGTKTTNYETGDYVSIATYTYTFN